METERLEHLTIPEEAESWDFVASRREVSREILPVCTNT